MANILDKIEQEYDIKYPEIYRQLYNNNMLGWGKTDVNGHNTTYPTLKKNPPLLLFGNDFEILDFDNIKNQIEAFKDPDDYRKISPDFKFIPFAQTAGGDLYAFQFDKQNGEEIPIVLLYHDEENAEVLAKNLQDFIFRQLLEIVTVIDEYSNFAEDRKMKENLSNLYRTHKGYLSENQQSIVKEIYDRELFEYKYKVPAGIEYAANGLLTDIELNSILQKEIGFEDLNATFNYMGEC